MGGWFGGWQKGLCLYGRYGNIELLHGLPAPEGAVHLTGVPRKRGLWLWVREPKRACAVLRGPVGVPNLLAY